jgi:hypothetical protein
MSSTLLIGARLFGRGEKASPVPARLTLTRASRCCRGGAYNSVHSGITVLNQERRRLTIQFCSDMRRLKRARAPVHPHLGTSPTRCRHSLKLGRSSLAPTLQRISRLKCHTIENLVATIDSNGSQILTGSAFGLAEERRRQRQATAAAFILALRSIYRGFDSAAALLPDTQSGQKSFSMQMPEVWAFLNGCKSKMFSLDLRDNPRTRGVATSKRS